MKKLYKLCYKSSIKPDLNYIKVSGDTMEATDTYRWARVKNKGYKDGYHNLKTGEFREDINFPDVNIIIEEVKKNNTDCYKVNRKYLIEILEALDKGGDTDTVNIHINPNSLQKPIYFTNTNGEALLMPCLVK